MIKFYKFIFQRINKKYKLLFLLESIILLVINALQIVLPIIQKKIIDTILIRDILHSELKLMILITLAGILLSFILIFIKSSIMLFCQRRMQLEMIISSYLQDNKIIDSRGSGGYLVSVYGDTEHVTQIINDNIVEGIAQVISVVFIAIYSLKWSYTFIFIISIAYSLLIVSYIFTTKIYGKKFSIAREKVMEMNPKVLELIENRKTVLGYGNAHNEMKNILKSSKERDKYFKNAEVIDGASNMLSSAIRTLSMMIFFICSMYQLSQGILEISSFIALLTCFSYIFIPVESIKKYFMNAKKFKMMKQKIEPGLLREQKNFIPENHLLSINNVSYKYNDGRDILKNIKIDINKKIGIVGLSGEGKSTLVKILLGEIEANEGFCSYGNVNTSNISRSIAYSLIRYYKQEPEIFDEDLKYNITLGKQGIMQKDVVSIISDKFDFIKNALHEKNNTIKLKDFIESLFLIGGNEYFSNSSFYEIKNNLINCNDEQLLMLCQIYFSKNYYVIEKYNDIIKELNISNLEGRKFGQHGKCVSGGEKNRIVLARFLLPEFGKFFIIDEPFISLDKINENECLKIMEKYTKDMVGILISHKMNIIQEFCDEIQIMEEGNITYCGSHAEVIKNSNLYRSLCEK